ncbi:hypothetical protein ColKHC_07367 [Colletotrichum higginsianum]|nr:hypothetical protein ColKHC_07367 [Colletotrichum higginsianum]
MAYKWSTPKELLALWKDKRVVCLAWINANFVQHGDPRRLGLTLQLPDGLRHIARRHDVRLAPDSGIYHGRVMHEGD